MKQLLIFLLIAGHIIVNGVAAAVHMTGDHDDGSHMHLELQLSDATLYQFKHVQIGRHFELKQLFHQLTIHRRCHPFYRALIQNELAVLKLEDENLRELARHVTEKLRNSTTVDWQHRDSVRAKLRNLVRRALRRWKHPPDRA